MAVDSRSAGDFNIAVRVLQTQSAGPVTDGAVKGIARHCAGGSDRQFAIDVAERCAGTDFVAAIGGNANGDVRKGSF